MTTSQPPKIQMRLSGLGAQLQSILSSAGIAESGQAGVERFFAQNILTLSLGLDSWKWTPNKHGAHTLYNLPDATSSNETSVAPESTAKGFRTMESLLTDVTERLDELGKNPSVVTGVPTGFAELDEKTSGMSPGDLIIVAGVAASGKTTFALNVTEHVALATGLPVLFFSMELSGQEIARRVLSSVAKVDQERLRKGQLDAGDWERIETAKGKLQEAPIVVEDATALNTHDLCSAARLKWREYGGLGLIVVDTLQALASASVGKSGVVEFPETARELKALAEELGVAILLTSQRVDKPENRAGQRPGVSALRDYGTVEQAADVIFFIHRDEITGVDCIDKDPVEIIVAKQVNGPPSAIKLLFVSQYLRFEEP